MLDRILTRWRVWRLKRQLKDLHLDIQLLNRAADIKRAACHEIEGDILPALRVRRADLEVRIRQLSSPAVRHTPQSPHIQHTLQLAIPPSSFRTAALRVVKTNTQHEARHERHL